MTEIPVTAYVSKYLKGEFGLGPYVIDTNPRHPLRIEFLSVSAHAHTYLSVHTLSSIHIQFSSSTTLSKYHEEQHARFDRGVYGLHLFFEAMYNHVIAEHRITDNYYHAVQNFLQKYNITEDDYSLDNAWRQFTRKKKSRASGTSSAGITIPPKHVSIETVPKPFTIRFPFFSTSTVHSVSSNTQE